MAAITKHLIVSGLVQGVFFRAWTVETANRLGLRGWVRNRSNGDVEALLQGEEAVVEEMIDHIWKGPPVARVEDVLVADHLAERLSGFEKRATL